MEQFNYTYSAKQQEEIKNIRKKYVAQEEDKMELLRRLDQSVSQKATSVSIAVGIIGIATLCCAYPLYNYTVKKEREKIAPEVIRLTDELLK